MLGNDIVEAFLWRIGARPGLHRVAGLYALKPTAVVAGIVEETYPFSTLRGGANVLLFPDLTSANTCYKLLGYSAQPKPSGRSGCQSRFTC